MEADIYPKNYPEAAERVDGAIGEASSFHEIHGYYAQGVGPETAVLPSAWQGRLVSINNENTNGITGLCPEVHDLTVSKLIAGRTKDLEFVQELVKHQMVDQITLHERLEMTDISKAAQRLATNRIQALFSR